MNKSVLSLSLFSCNLSEKYKTNREKSGSRLFPAVLRPFELPASKLVAIVFNFRFNGGFFLGITAGRSFAFTAASSPSGMLVWSRTCSTSSLAVAIAVPAFVWRGKHQTACGRRICKCHSLSASPTRPRRVSGKLLPVAHCLGALIFVFLCILYSVRVCVMIWVYV